LIREVFVLIKSIHDLPPIETGGVEARTGFAIQDHVAVGFCLDLLENQRLKQVWCENQDDLTLLWGSNSQDKVEFVQIKGGESGQLWSTAKLCERRKRDGREVVGSSMLERSLQNDRCCEQCCFRIVTIQPVRAELKPLTYNFDSPGRISYQAAIDNLIIDIGSRVGDFISENKNGHDFWIRHLFWVEAFSLDSIKNANMIKLARLVEAEGPVLFTDQKEELYGRLLSKVCIAAQSHWRNNPEMKKLRKAEFAVWFRGQVENIVFPGSLGGGRTVKVKMAQAHLSQDTIKTANDQRRRYWQALLRPQYLMKTDMGFIEGEVAAILQDLRSQLDAGIISDSGVEFHARCLRSLSDLRGQLPIKSSPPLAFLHGCMYSFVDRCLHRFIRAET
jgi:hypothetical protein